jgi:hypothetical protein
MRANLLFAFLGCFSFHSLFAQNADIQWGSSFKLPLPADIVYVGKEPGTENSYWVTTEGTTKSLLKLDSNNTKLFYKKIELKDTIGIASGKSIVILNCTILKDRIVIFAISCGSKKTDCEAFIHQLSFNGADLSINKEIFKVKGESLTEYALALSPDSSKFVVVENIQNQRDIRKHGFFIKTFDSKLNLLDSKDMYASDSNGLDYDRIDIEEVDLSNSGQVYILGRKIDLKNDERTVGFWTTGPLMKQLVDMPMELGENELGDARCTLTKEGEVVVAGFYYKNDSISSDMRPYAGTCYGKVDKEKNKINFQAFNALPKGLEPMPAKGYITDKLLSSIYKEDGGMILFSEHVFFIAEQEHLGNVLIVNYEKDGTLTYSTAFFKDHHKHLLSYFVEYSFLPVYHNKAKTLKIVYNENPKNWGLTDEKLRVPMMFPNKSIPMIATFDKGGKISQQKLFEGTVNPNTVCPQLSKQMEDNKAIVFGIQQKDLVVGDLILK